MTVTDWPTFTIACATLASLWPLWRLLNGWLDTTDTDPESEAWISNTLLEIRCLPECVVDQDREAA